MCAVHDGGGDDAGAPGNNLSHQTSSSCCQERLTNTINLYCGDRCTTAHARVNLFISKGAWCTLDAIVKALRWGEEY